MKLTKGDIQKRNTPGEWYVLNGWVYINCPECKTARHIIHHRIESDGTVTPSVVCNLKKCSWHQNVQLEGWDGGIQVGLPVTQKAGAKDG